MKRSLGILSLCFAGIANLSAADAERGAAVLRNQNCLSCHTVRGEGAAVPKGGHAAAPDLAARLVSEYTPSALAAALWNHTPAMWEAMNVARVDRPAPADADWEDLFAYLYSLQFFERPDTEGHGKETFHTRRCAECHALKGPAKGAAEPVSEWKSVGDPVSLIYQMWRHGDAMGEEFGAQKKAWPKLSGQEYGDLTTYVQGVQKVPLKRRFSLPEPAAGRLPFEDNCRSCHTGPNALENKLENRTWREIGAGMWNHAPLMKPLPKVSKDEMAGIISYVWDLQYTGTKANLAHGRQVFDVKNCVSCHRSPGDQEPMSPRSRKVFTPFTMMALGWGPAREMHQQMVAKGVKWPNLTAEDMTDLVAYLGSISRE